jgi:hypothetical protein
MLNMFAFLLVTSSGLTAVGLTACNVPVQGSEPATWVDLSGCDANVVISECKFKSITGNTERSPALQFSTLNSVHIFGSEFWKLSSHSFAVVIDAVKQLVFESTSFKELDWVGVLKTTEKSEQMWIFNLTLENIKFSNGALMTTSFRYVFCDVMTAKDLDLSRFFGLPAWDSDDATPTFRNLDFSGVKGSSQTLFAWADNKLPSYLAFENSKYENTKNVFQSAVTLYYEKCIFFERKWERLVLE